MTGILDSELCVLLAIGHPPLLVALIGFLPNITKKGGFFQDICFCAQAQN
jgi:hypothetical protein